MYEEQTTKDTIYMSTFQKISKDLKNRLDKKRYTHTLSVADTAACMAMRFDEDPYRAYLAGLLHDIDFEMYPEQHCIKAPELLREAGAEEELIHAICSHGYGIACDVKPEHEMEKVLFAVDELTGLVGAAARMRPSRSVMDMEVSSLKKKFKDKKFAAGCSRDVIREGAENLGWTLEELMEKTILAMRSCEESVNKEMEN